MKNIIAITDLQRQAGQIVSRLAGSDESVVITQRGRPAAVLLGAEAFARIEQDLEKLDELELLMMVETAREQIRNNKTFEHSEVKARIARRNQTEPDAKRSSR